MACLHLWGCNHFSAVRRAVFEDAKDVISIKKWDESTTGSLDTLIERVDQLMLLQKKMVEKRKIIIRKEKRIALSEFIMITSNYKIALEELRSSSKSDSVSKMGWVNIDSVLYHEIKNRSVSVARANAKQTRNAFNASLYNFYQYYGHCRSYNGLKDYMTRDSLQKTISQK